MDPLLKWVGGKRWQVPLLKRLWFTGKHTQRRLVEPFCGGLSVALGLEPSAALLNDANPHLINFYRQVQRGLVFDLDLEVGDYYANREWFNALVREGHGDTPEAAMLFYYLNKFGFNGLCRFNQSGEFNVPQGRSSSDVQPIPTHKARHALARYTFTQGDFRTALDAAQPEDFIYADPPYDDGFTNYTGAEFSWQDQEALAIRLFFTPRPGPVIVTNLATPRIMELYQDAKAHVLTLPAPRRVSASAEGRAPVLEVIASNFPIDQRVTIGVPLEGE